MFINVVFDWEREYSRFERSAEGVLKEQEPAQGRIEE